MANSSPPIPVGGANSYGVAEAFLNNVARQDAKILARTNTQGEIVLYEKPKPSGFKEKISALLDRVTGRTERREQRAIAFIRTAIENKLEAAGGADAGVAKAYFKSAFAKRAERNELTAANLGALMIGARNLPPPTHTPPTYGGSPSMASLGISATDPAIIEAAKTMAADPKKVGEVVGKLGDMILQKFTAQNNALTGDNKTADAKAFALSDGLKLATELRAALKGALQANHPNARAEALPYLNEVLGAFHKAAAKVTTDGPEPGGPLTKLLTKDGKPHLLPNMTFGKIKYEPVQFVGAGGFANVVKYRSLDGKNTFIAVKIAKDLDELKGDEAGEVNIKNVNHHASQIKGMANEIDANANAADPGCENLIAFKGWSRLENGNIAIAMEFAANGDAHTAGTRAREMVKPLDPQDPERGTLPQISKEQADIVALTIIKDMAKALAYLHDIKKTAHKDLKSPNGFITENGVTKVGDLGEAMVLEGTEKVENTAKIENPTYHPPEMQRAYTRWNDADSKYREQVGQVVANLQTKLLAAFGNVSRAKAFVDLLVRNAMDAPISVFEAGRQQAIPGDVFDRQIDMWGLGASLAEMLSNKPIGIQHRFASEASRMIAEYGDGNAEPLSDPGPDGYPQNGAIALKSGNPLIDNLLSRLLAKKPGDRPTASQVLNDPALSEENGVGTDAAYALIAAINSNDAEKVKTSSEALGKAVEKGKEKQEMDEIKALVSDVDTAIDDINDQLESMEIQNILDDVNTAIDDINEELKFLDTSPVPEDESSMEAKQREDAAKDSEIGSDTSTNTVSGSSTPDEFDTIAKQMEDDLKALDDLIAETEMPELPETPAPETAPTPNEAKDRTTPNSGRPLPTPPVGPRNGQ